MPHRIRSVRGRRNGTKDIVINPPEYFDFDFRIDSEHNADSHMVLSNGPDSNPLTAEPEERNAASRPWTSEGKRATDKRLQLTKIDESWIGLAIGSPTHPPNGWSLNPFLTSEQQIVSPATSSSPQSPSKWQQIGGLFKARSVTGKYRLAPHGIQAGRAERDKISESPADDQPRQDKCCTIRPPMVPVLLDVALAPNKHDSTAPIATATTLPKLELDIPSLHFERYSIMFRGVADAFPEDRPQENRPPASNSAPRESMDESTLLHSPVEQRVQRLEPIPPHKSVGANADINDIRYKVSTTDNAPEATEQLLSTFKKLRKPLADAHEKFESNDQQLWVGREPVLTPVKPRPLHPRRRPSSEFATSPTGSDTKLEREYTPSTISESPRSTTSSHTSIGDEIFFDLKPLRDSRGTRDSQYVVTKPDPSAVQLARSVSQKVKQRNRQDVPNCDPAPEAQAESWTLPPDVQAAEHFCMSPDLKSAQYALRMSMFDRAIEEVERFSPTAHDMPPLPTIGSPDRCKPYLDIPLRPQGLGIGIPSPIAERSCESTPTTPVYGKNAARSTSQRHTANENSPPRSSNRLPNLEKPPPVPKKDKKFLPRSKFAINHDTKSSMDQDCFRPKVRLRVATDPVNSPSQNESISRKRSATLPIKPDTGNLTHHSRKKIESGIVAIAVKPAAEVSVARSISLSRKASHEITVARSSSKREAESGSDIATATSAAAANVTVIRTTESRQEFERMNRTRALSPVVSQGQKGHKPGASVNGLLEDA